MSNYIPSSSSNSISSYVSPSPIRGSFRPAQTVLYDIPPASPDHLYTANLTRSGDDNDSTGPIGYSTISPPKTAGGIRAMQAQQKVQPRRPPSRQGSPTKGVGGDAASRSGSRERGAAPPLPGPRGQGRSSPQKEGSVYGASSTFSKRGEGVGSPSPADLNLFAYHCQLFYFHSGPNPPEASATYISTTLASLPPSHRAAFTRIQSSLRAQSHDHALRLRLSQFHALISSTVPNASLTPLARSDLSGARAKKERRDRLKRFLEAWCVKSGDTAGVEPFFKGLWTGLKLQGKGERGVGGAGGRRVVWEIDDAVFMEAGGKEFMHEAIAIIKGVLGFEDLALTRPPRIRRPTIHIHPKTGSLPSNSVLSSNSIERLNSTPARPTRQNSADNNNNLNNLSSRSRAQSDPFTDPSLSPGMRQTPGGKLGRGGPPPPLPLNPPTLRSTSGRGPAPPPPRSRQDQGPSRPTLNISPAGEGAPYMETRSSSGYSDSGNPLSPNPDVEAPLLRHQSSVVSRLEEVAERQDRLGGMMNDRRGSAAGFRGEIRVDDHEFLLGNRENRYGEVVEDEDEDEDLTAPRLRLWTFPAHISDPELDGLVSLFPTFISKSAGSKNLRFPLPRPASLTAAIKAHDAEAGRETTRIGEDEWPLVLGIKVPPEGSDGFLRPGTGRMWVGEGGRDAAYRGGFWARVGRWFRRLFGG